MGQGAVASGDQGQLSRRLFGRRAAGVVGGGVLGSVLLPSTLDGREIAARASIRLAAGLILLTQKIGDLNTRLLKK